MPTARDAFRGSVPLPGPTGSFSVARTWRECSDPHRADPHAAGPSDRRRLVLCFWYPVTRPPGGSRATYLPTEWRAVAAGLGVDTDGLWSNAFDGPPIAEEQARYPTILLSPGGFPPMLLSGIAEELTSHGYVVVGVDHTNESTVTRLPDGPVARFNPAEVTDALGTPGGPHDEAFARRAAVCRCQAADLAFVATELARAQAGDDSLLSGRIDLSRLGAVGHSFGGCASLHWCRDDRRCRAAVNLDGVVWSDVAETGVVCPALQLLSPHAEFDLAADQAVAAGLAPDTEWFEAERRIAFGGWRAVDQLSRLSYSFVIRGAGHLGFTDLPFLPAEQDSPLRPLLDDLTIHPRRMWEILGAITLAFLDRHLDGGPSGLLDDPCVRFPDVVAGVP